MAKTWRSILTSQIDFKFRIAFFVEIYNKLGSDCSIKHWYTAVHEMTLWRAVRCASEHAQNAHHSRQTQKTNRHSSSSQQLTCAELQLRRCSGAVFEWFEIIFFFSKNSILAGNSPFGCDGLMIFDDEDVITKMKLCCYLFFRVSLKIIL